MSESPCYTRLQRQQRYLRGASACRHRGQSPAVRALFIPEGAYLYTEGIGLLTVEVSCETRSGQRLWRWMRSSRGVKRASSAGSTCSTIRFWARGPRHSGENFIWCMDGITRNSSAASRRHDEAKALNTGGLFCTRSFHYFICSRRSSS